MGRSRNKIFETEYPYFITSSFVHGLPLFSRPAVAKIVIDTFRYHQETNELCIYAWCLMEHHFHAIVSHEELTKIIQSIKAYSAKKILEHLKVSNNLLYLKQLQFGKKNWKHDSHFQVWQEGFHPMQVYSREVMQQKIDYIHYNPVKRGYVDRPTDWRYSSARDHEGDRGLLKIERDF